MGLEKEKNDLPFVSEASEVGGRDEEMISFLEVKLESIEKQLKSTQGNFEQLSSDYSNLREKLHQGKEKFKRAALLMSEFLNDILSDKSNILTDASTLNESSHPLSQIEVNLQKVRDSDIQDLDREDKQRLVFTLLKQIQPYLSAANLAADPNRQDLLSH